ncbi:hypothetical protein SmJEL517_g05232 [Synchytrium microbalum]|uniref:Mitochondrial glyco protein n=1 Tax=Synchytrium microbalum TaxID=1806994 RepID=A0A507BX42_9FUNG|nr:uncharacterized protein SmJEL517_g05232 [Synchytrium microbalum]TPX31429.1 hypothetical protein SmJEL517_g05232 [Synchytrium microbalum]
MFRAARTLSCLRMSSSQYALARVSVSRMAPMPSLLAPTSSMVRFSHGLVDKDLSHKLKEELQYEKENEEKALPPFLKSFQDLGTFKIEDKPGNKEVALTRAFGNEKISVIFSTDALAQEDEEMMEDSIEGQKEEAETEGMSLSIPVTIIIDKKAGSTDSGAIEVSATVQDDVFFIDSVSYRRSSSVAHDESAEGDWQRRGGYGGPVFADLDEDLQDLFHKYLEERGFDPTLADFIPNYLEYKEQKEYVAWLSNIGEFVAK